MSESVAIVASFFPKPSHEKQVEEVLRDIVSATRTEPGNRRYELYAGNGAPPATFVLLETYKDQSALETHRGTNHYKTFEVRISNLLSQPVKVQVLRAVDIGR
jgi:quinol monooxygenase YgiN